MADLRTGRRGDRRAFRPTMDGTLETRLLMAASAIRSQTAAGGQAVVITAIDGVRYFVSVDNGGTVRATAASGGRVNLFVDGTNSGSNLEVNRVVPKQLQNTAHTFKSQGTAVSRLNIASITVSSGAIGAIEGYQTATLSGPLVVNNSVRVDRIALNSILPGGSIAVSGDLNTLDIYRNVNLNGGNISVGRDLNWFQTFGDVTLANNANITVGRDLGGTFQIAKGSGNGGQGVYIGGNLTINPGSAVAVGRNIPYPAGVLINGDLTGATLFTVAGFNPFNPSPTYNFYNVDVLGTIGR